MASAVACVFEIFCLTLVEFSEYKMQTLKLRAELASARNQVNLEQLKFLDAMKTHKLKESVESFVAEALYEESSFVINAVENFAAASKKNGDRCVQQAKEKVRQVSADKLKIFEPCFVELFVIYKNLTENIQSTIQVASVMPDKYATLLQNCQSQGSVSICADDHLEELRETLDDNDQAANEYQITLDMGMEKLQEVMTCVNEKRVDLRSALKVVEQEGAVCVLSAPA